MSFFVSFTRLVCVCFSRSCRSIDTHSAAESQFLNDSSHNTNSANPGGGQTAVQTDGPGTLVARNGVEREHTPAVEPTAQNSTGTGTTPQPNSPPSDCLSNNSGSSDVDQGPSGLMPTVPLRETVPLCNAGGQDECSDGTFPLNSSLQNTNSANPGDGERAVQTDGPGTLAAGNGVEREQRPAVEPTAQNSTGTGTKPQPNSLSSDQGPCGLMPTAPLLETVSLCNAGGQDECSDGTFETGWW